MLALAAWMLAASRWWRIGAATAWPGDQRWLAGSSAVRRSFSATRGKATLLLRIATAESEQPWLTALPVRVPTGGFAPTKDRGSRSAAVALLVSA